MAGDGPVPYERAGCSTGDGDYRICHTPLLIGPMMVHVKSCICAEFLCLLAMLEAGVAWQLPPSMLALNRDIMLRLAAVATWLWHGATSTVLGARLGSDVICGQCRS